MSDAILDPTTADATAPTAEPGPVLTPIQEAAARLKELYPDVVSDDTREGYEGLVVYADSLPEVAKSLRDELGWKPRHTDFEAGLRATIDWYRANEAWWVPLKEAAEARYAALGR